MHNGRKFLKTTADGYRPDNLLIRGHAKPLPLDLQTYGGDQAENLGQKLLGSHPTDSHGSRQASRRRQRRSETP
jgi:hypothetical protein